MLIHRRIRRAFGHSLLALTLLLTLAPASRATWSIILVDTSTGEIAIGCATCLTDFDLELFVPVMLVGTGGGCCQARVDGSARNRRIIWDELLKGTLPSDIMQLIKDVDPNFNQRQIGIVDMQGRRAAHTGNKTGGWSGHVRGQDGYIAYTIQGNVLTGEPVVLAARDAVLNTPGDLAGKLMAGMEAARAFGGDGRCSCGTDPEACGSPPPSFEKSAHVGFMMLSRIGDLDGTCDVSVGCSTGSYYMNFNVAFQRQDDEDPVLQLRKLFDAWRQELLLHPDHLQSEKSVRDPVLPGNGTATTSLAMQLFDWAKNPIQVGGHQIEVGHAADSAGLALIGTVVDHGDGSYEVPLTAGSGQGVDRFEIWVDDGSSRVLLFPLPFLENGPTLVADQTSVSASLGADVGFQLLGPSVPVGRGYLLLGSGAGTEPGLDIGSAHLALNPDIVMICSYVDRNGPNLIGTEGDLSAEGEGQCRLVAAPGLLNPMVGYSLYFSYLVFDPLDFASNAVTISIDP